MIVTLHPSRIVISENGFSLAFQGVDIIQARYVTNPPSTTGGATQYFVELTLTGNAREALGGTFKIGPLDVINNQPTWTADDKGAKQAVADIQPIIRAFPVAPGSVSVKNSIEYDGGQIQFVGDDPAPGPDHVYGTDAAGNKLWKPDPTAGDVVGPASATDNAITRYNLTTGKLIQNSTVLLDDNGKLGQVDAIDFDTTPTSAPAAGRMLWDSTEGSPQVGLAGGNVAALIGTDLHVLCYNDTGSPMTKGQVIRVNGSSGTRLKIAYAQADGDPNSAETIGLVAETIGNNSSGYVITRGLIRSINTNSFNEGDVLYLSPTVAGQITNVKPVAPDHMVRVGYCIKKSGGAGIIYVDPLNGFELEELHDVRITTPATNTCGVYWNAVDSVWENRTPANARTALGLKTAATANTGDFDAAGSAAAAQSAAIAAAATDATTKANAAAAASVPIALLDAKGDLITASADNTPFRLQAGTNGAVLRADSGATGGLSYGFTGIHVPHVPPSGNYVIPTVVSLALATIGGAAGRIDFYPFVPAKTFTIDRLALEVTTLIAASQLKIGIYSDLAGIPNALLLGTGNIDGASNGVKFEAATFTFVAGTPYWLAVHFSSTTTVRGIAVGGLIQLAHPAAGGATLSTVRRATVTYASGLPNPAPAATLNGATAPVVMLRVA